MPALGGILRPDGGMSYQYGQTARRPTGKYQGDVETLLRKVCPDGGLS